jgi:hypothetical protein
MFNSGFLNKTEDSLCDHGFCSWPKCTSEKYETREEFQKHLNETHKFGSKSHLDLKIQLNLLNCLEKELEKQKNIFYDMVNHLSNQIVNEEKNRDDFESEIDILTNDVKEPSTTIQKCLEQPNISYTVLIKQAILDSPERQLYTSEIYDWLYKNFDYFRNNLGNNVKKSIRSALSERKCFKRVKFGNEKSKWTFDEKEFMTMKTRRLGIQSTQSKKGNRLKRKLETRKESDKQLNQSFF